MKIIEYTEGMEIESGMCISGMPNHIYYSHTAWNGSTDIKNGIRSIDYYRWKKNNKETLYSVPVEFGSGYHGAMESALETGSYDQFHKMCMTHKGKKVTKEFRQLKDDFPDKIILRKGEPVILEELATRTFQDAEELEIFNNGYSELSFFWTDPTTGVKCKCRPDYFRPDIPFMVDYKTSLEHNEKEFSKIIANRNYHLSAAFYMEGVFQVTGLETEDFCFIAVNNTPPCEIEFYPLKQEAKDQGKFLFRNILKGIIKKRPQPSFKPISIPFWAMTKIDGEY